MAGLTAIFIAVAILLFVIMLILIVIFIRSRRTLIATSSTLSKVPCTAPPVAPINLNVINPQSDVLLLSWSRVVGALSYTAYLSEDPNFSPVNALQSRVTTSNSTSFSNLTLGTTYYLKVKATNSCGDSPLSSEVTTRLTYVFPRRFMVSNLSNPQLRLCDTHDDVNAFLDSVTTRLTDRIIASRTCSLLGASWWYQNRDRSIRQIDRPTRCLTRIENGVLSFDPCVSDARQTWEYSNQTNNLCDPSGQQCINLGPGFTSDLGTVSYGPPTTPVLSDWLIA